MQTVFKKLKYSSLVESTKIENITFPYKTALSESNAKTNRMGSTMDLSQSLVRCRKCTHIIQSLDWKMKRPL